MKFSTMIFVMCFALAPVAAHAGGMRLMGGGMGGTHGGGMSAISAGMNNGGDQMTSWSGGSRHRGTGCPHGRLRSKGLPLFSLLLPCGAKF